MSQSSPANSSPNPAPARGSDHLRWDTSAMQTHRCTVASAGATGDAVVINFGAKLGSELRGSGFRVELLQRIALSPLTAKHFTATLQRLIADTDRLSVPAR